MKILNVEAIPAQCASCQLYRDEIDELRREIHVRGVKLTALRLAVKNLGQVAGGVMVTDGDTTCTLDYWCRQVLKEGGK